MMRKNILKQNVRVWFYTRELYCKFFPYLLAYGFQREVSKILVFQSVENYPHLLNTLIHSASKYLKYESQHEIFFRKC